MFISKAILAALLTLLSALTARLVQDELRLRSIEDSTKTLAKFIADQQRDAAKFQKDMDEFRKKHPTAWRGNAAKTIQSW